MKTKLLSCPSVTRPCKALSLTSVHSPEYFCRGSGRGVVLHGLGELSRSGGAQWELRLQPSVGGSRGWGLGTADVFEMCIAPCVTLVGEKRKPMDDSQASGWRGAEVSGEGGARFR